MMSITCYESDGNILKYYTQWDTNQKLIIKGADTSSAPQFHFSNNIITKSIVAPSALESGGLAAFVPDILLQYPEPIIVHIYYKHGDSGSSKYSVRIPVMPRKEPDGYIYSNGDDGIVLDYTEIIIDDMAPDRNAVLWFDTSTVD